MYYVRFKEWWGLRSWKLSVTGMNQIWAEGKAKKLLSPFAPSLLQLFLPLMSEVREQVKWKSDWEVVHVTLSYCFKNIYFYLCLFFFLPLYWSLTCLLGPLDIFPHFIFSFQPCPGSRSPEACWFCSTMSSSHRAHSHLSITGTFSDMCIISVISA